MRTLAVIGVIVVVFVALSLFFTSVDANHHCHLQGWQRDQGASCGSWGGHR